VLLFVDNIFRFYKQAGSEVSALLGRIPSAVVTQPTLPPRWAICKSASPRPTRDRSRACRPLLRAGRRLDRPRAGHDLRALGRHHRALALHTPRRSILTRAGRSGSTHQHPCSRPRLVGEEHYSVARPSVGQADVAEIQRPAGTSSPSWAWTRLSEDVSRHLWRARAKSSDRAFCRRPFFVAQQFTGRSGKYVPLKRDVAGFKEILSGRARRSARAGLLHGRQHRRRPSKKAPV